MICNSNQRVMKKGSSPINHVQVATHLQAQRSNATHIDPLQLTAMLRSTHTLGILLALNQANLQAYPEGANNIQTSIGSRNSAIHNA